MFFCCFNKAMVHHLNLALCWPWQRLSRILQSHVDSCLLVRMEATGNKGRRAKEAKHICWQWFRFVLVKNDLVVTCRLSPPTSVQTQAANWTVKKWAGHVIGGIGLDIHLLHQNPRNTIPVIRLTANMFRDTMERKNTNTSLERFRLHSRFCVVKFMCWN